MIKKISLLERVMSGISPQLEMFKMTMGPVHSSNISGTLCLHLAALG